MEETQNEGFFFLLGNTLLSNIRQEEFPLPKSSIGAVGTRSLRTENCFQVLVISIPVLVLLEAASNMEKSPGSLTKISTPREPLQVSASLPAATLRPALTSDLSYGMVGIRSAFILRPQM